MNGMGLMRYKGYTGSVEYSEEDNCLFGKVQGLPRGTCVTYEGSTVDELKADFEGAVDDYVASCRARGVEPEKSFSGSLNVRLTPEIHSRVAMLAKRAGMSINAFIRSAVERQVAAMM